MVVAIVFLFLSWSTSSFVSGFHPVVVFKYKTSFVLAVNNNNNDGYKFGDLTRGLLRKGTEKINKITGADHYEFGDLSKHLDAKAKERILKARGKNNNINNEDDDNNYSYQFGDLSRWASHLIKEKAVAFTGNDDDDYTFGDITKTIIRRVRSGEYRMDDVYLALRILVTAGVAILPITNALPIKILLQLAEADLVKDTSVRITEAVATSLDARFKQAITGKADYQLGDLTKERLKQQVMKFTGKEDYEFGDIVRALPRKKVEDLTTALENTTSERELLDWDERFLNANMK